MNLANNRNVHYSRAPNFVFPKGFPPDYRYGGPVSDPDVAPDVREAVVTRWLQLLGLKHNGRSPNLRMASQKP